MSLWGEITSGEVLKAAIVKDVMYKESATLSIGTKIFAPKPWPNLDAKWAFPLEVDGEFPVPEGAVARRARVEWVEWGAVMEMAEFRFMLTDFAVARQLAQHTYNVMVQRGAEYFADKQDEQILDGIYGGAGATTVTVGAGNEWDDNAVSADIEGDIMDAWGYLIDESNIRIEDMRNVCLIYPAKIDGRLRGLSLINNIHQSLMDYVGKSFGFTFYPTRYYHESSSVGIQDDAVLMVQGDRTGLHGVYSGGAIPLAETERVFGRGMDYLTKKLFFTKIEPDTQSDPTSDRICKIANVI